MFKFLQDLANKLSGREEEEEEEELLAKDFSNYVERKADEELYNFIKTPDLPLRLCYVLAPPQSGKTCLRKKAVSRVSKEGYNCFQFTLQLSAKTCSESAFYLHLLTKICQNLSREGMNLVEILDKFWREAELQQPHERFQNFLKEIFKKLISCKVIIFIDNVQKLREWKIHQRVLETIKNLFQSGDESLQKLTFVLLGTDNPLDFFSDPDRASLGTEIQLDNFRGDCLPLLGRLKSKNPPQPPFERGEINVSNDPEALLDEILSQTGGQPFLTQSLCSFVAKGGRIGQGTNFQVHIEELVGSIEVGNWSDRSEIKSHFQSIEDYFLGEPLENIDRKLYALNLYDCIKDGKIYEYKENSAVQRDLLMSGLVRKTDKLLRVANPIYAQVFTQTWVKETKQKLRQRRGFMVSPKIYNRKVYMLIDQSGSMVDPDPLFGGQRRWKALPEAIKGHVYGILEEEGMDGEKISDEITVTFFSTNSPNPYSRVIYSDQDIKNVFLDNRPGTNTYITPTLSKVISNFIATREQDQGGFIIIYTDGALDDAAAFESLINSTCANLESQDDLKIVIIGIGSDVERNPRPYLELDANTNNNSDKNSNSCNIVVFDTLTRMPNIIDLLARQLVDAKAGLAEWGREFCPELYD